MELKEAGISLLVILGIVHGYFYFTQRIDLQNSGKVAIAVVLEKELTPNYSYVRFKYSAGEKEFIKSIRLEEKNGFEEGSTFEIRYLPEKPDEPHMNFKKEELNQEIYYVMVFFLVYLIYRSIMVALRSTSPQWDEMRF